MMDYLEHLLDEQEQEETRQVLEWKHVVFPVSTRTAPQEGPVPGTDPAPEQQIEVMASKEMSQTAQTTRAKQAALIPQMAQLAQAAQIAKTLQTAQAAQNAQLAQTAHKPTMYTQRGIDLEPQAAGETVRFNRPAVQSLMTEIMRLHRAVRHAGAQAGHRAVQGTTEANASVSASWRFGSSLPAAANYAAIVDTAFARDARRYDGPLGLL